MEISIDTEAWQYVVDKGNAAALAALPDKQKPSFVPVTLNAYVQARVDEVGASYASQQVADVKADPVFSARVQKLATQPANVRDQVLSQVDRLS